MWPVCVYSASGEAGPNNVMTVSRQEMRSTTNLHWMLLCCGRNFTIQGILASCWNVQMQTPRMVAASHERKHAIGTKAWQAHRREADVWGGACTDEQCAARVPQERALQNDVGECAGAGDMKQGNLLLP